MQYVGQTETPFRYRFNNHKAHITSLPHLPFSKHMQLPNHSFEQITVTLLETGFKSNYQREQRESYLLYKFDSRRNGINESQGRLNALSVV